jgi:hypothetical protein
MDHLDRALESSAFVRCLGMMTLGLTVGFASLTVYPPIAGAQAGQRVIFIHRYGVGAAFGCLLCGVIFLIAGRHVRHFMMMRWFDVRPLQICGTLLVVLACAVFQAWLESYFLELGFVVRRPP